MPKYVTIKTKKGKIIFLKNKKKKKKKIKTNTQV